MAGPERPRLEPPGMTTGIIHTVNGVARGREEKNAIYVPNRSSRVEYWPASRVTITRLKQPTLFLEIHNHCHCAAGQYIRYKLRLKQSYKSTTGGGVRRNPLRRRLPNARSLVVQVAPTMTVKTHRPIATGIYVLDPETAQLST